MKQFKKILVTGVMHAKMNNGAADKPSSHRQPNVGATAKARATSKQAPRAQKHWKSNIFQVNFNEISIQV